MEHSLVAAYLARLGVRREPPSLDFLTKLHRAHVERVPYETLWIHLNEQWDIGPSESIDRIVAQHRGGYCFHLNASFFELLTALGFTITRHVGAVHGPAGIQPDEEANHLALVAHDLDGSDWHVDAGLGDALHEPIRLVNGQVTQGPTTFTMHKLADSWRFEHDPVVGSFTAMNFGFVACNMSAFRERHAFLANAPESHFVRTLTVQRRDANGTDVLRGLVFTRIGSGRTTFACASANEWFTLLADVYGLTLENVPDNAKAALWRKTLTTHEAWLTRQSEEI